jgi:hypothetical protein
MYPSAVSRNGALSGRAVVAGVVAALAVATLTMLVVAPAPSYDPWSWLAWGREIAHGSLHTAEGPAFKPLPVAVCALLSLFGGAAPWLWVLIARTAALRALWLSFRLGRRLAGGSVAAGAVAAAGVALCGTFLALSSAGVITGLLLAFALGGVEAYRAGRPGVAFACAVACGLLQVETWPFLAVLATWAWRRKAVDRRALVIAGVAVPALWFVPDWLGSGELLRSAERARVPNPGQPALADVPALASLEQAVDTLLWPLWLGIVALGVVAWRAGGSSRSALVPAAVGLAWITVVAGMSQLGGFSGEPRYALPGMALVAVSGGVGLVTAGRSSPRRPAAIAAIGLVALAAIAPVGRLGQLPATQRYAWQLSSDLRDAIAAAGGRDAVLACGTPYVGPLRGPMFAYVLDVPKPSVEPDLAPRAPGTGFLSRRTAHMGIEPEPADGFATVAHTERWEVVRSCGVRLP